MFWGLRTAAKSAVKAQNDKKRARKLRGEVGVLWQNRFFDWAVRTVKEHHEKVEYTHLNPVKRGLVRRPEESQWSSSRDYTGTVVQAAQSGSALPIDRVLLPADQRARIARIQADPSVGKTSRGV